MTGTETQSGGIDRRTFIKGAGVATGVAATGASAGRLDLAPVGDATAVDPYTLAYGTTAAFGWALREGWEALTGDAPPEGLTPDSLQQKVYEAALKRDNDNGSKFIDQQNILIGIDNVAYTEGKIAAIEALNEEKSQSEVETAATSAVDSYGSTVIKNFLKAWNESLNEVEQQAEVLNSHADVDPVNVMYYPDDDWGSNSTGNTYSPAEFIPFETRGIELPDGTTFDTKMLQSQYSSGFTPAEFDGGDWSNGSLQRLRLRVEAPDGSQVTYLSDQEWMPVYDEITQTFTDVRDGLLLWVDNVYGQVQSGQIEVSDLITPRERAAMMTDDGKYPPSSR
ncbi:twin-arginine translocation signal domain-containing protein [Natronomonas sp. CBA1123]|uniref:twin-arginine translocation signal domain-containing protein n=1 Tax=Natronomonas sp. CBA1123 TaxID=2668070 RepID=UPI0018D26E3B|nr:twin-arginine translocation signal domain-containing protein [Natronomonas sp. CBA1123]